jgi:hypothetical protein
LFGSCVIILLRLLSFIDLHNKPVCVWNLALSRDKEGVSMFDVCSATAAVPSFAFPGAPVPMAKPSQFAEVVYTPALLLSVQLDAVLTEQADFAQACERGFNSYFEELYVDGQDGQFLCVDRVYSLAEVYHVVQESVMSFLDMRFGVTSLSWCAGFALGWLSALALAQPVEAHAALVVLQQAVKVAVCVRDVYLAARRG